MTLGERIQGRLNELDQKPAWLIERTGIKGGTIYDLLNGTQKSTRYIGTLAHHLGVHALWLETGEGPRLLDEPPLPSANIKPVVLRRLLDLFERLAPSQQAEQLESMANVVETNERFVAEMPPAYRLRRVLSDEELAENLAASERRDEESPEEGS